METHSVALTLLGIVLIFVQITLGDPQWEIRDGLEVDNLRRFPHHVTIVRKETYCGGSIISDQWILTAAHCVSADEFTIHFLFKNLSNAKGSFSVTLDQSSVTAYPTDFDNIALVQLPVVLQFSDKLAPISYSVGDLPSNGFAVMPGFSPQKTQALTYGMFKLVSPRECAARDDRPFDEYLQICTVSWNNNSKLSCQSNEGSGLITGWPREPRLIGIFSPPLNCVSEVREIYVKLAEYEKWIDQTIGRWRTTRGPTKTTAPPSSGSTTTSITTPSPPPAPPSTISSTEPTGTTKSVSLTTTV